MCIWFIKFLWFSNYSLIARGSYIICGTQYKMKIQSPLFKKQEKLFSFLLWSPSQPVVVFFIFYSALCTLGQMGTWRECRPSQALQTVQISTVDVRTQPIPPWRTNPSLLLHQSMVGGGGVRGEGGREGNSGHWVGVEEHSKEPRL